MSTRDWTALVYVLIGALALGVILWSARHPASMAPLSRLVAWMSDSRAARLMLVLFWWWIAWHFFVTPPVLNQ